MWAAAPRVVSRARQVALRGARRMTTATPASPTPTPASPTPTPASPTPTPPETWSGAWEAVPHKEVLVFIVPSVLTVLAAGLMEYSSIKTDLGHVKDSHTELKNTIDATKKELHDDMKALNTKMDSTRKELHATMDATKKELHDDMKALNAKMDSTQKELHATMDATKKELHDDMKALNTKMDSTKMELHATMDSTKMELLAKMDTLHAVMQENVLDVKVKQAVMEYRMNAEAASPKRTSGWWLW